MTTIPFGQLNCEGCPAREFFDLSRSRAVETMRLRALERLKGQPKTLLLCESAPVDRFVYDPASDYTQSGLRYNLRKELSVRTDESLFKDLDSRGVWIIDAALCPLHKGRILSNKQRREAATLCIERHTRVYLDSFPKTRLYTAFPSHCGFLKRRLPELASRVAKSFDFNVAGLRDALNEPM